MFNWFLNLQRLWLRVRLDTAENWKYYSKIIFKYVNSVVGLIWKSCWIKRFVGSVNNARDPLEIHNSHRNALSKKKKKKRENAIVNAPNSISKQILSGLATESFIFLFSFCFYFLFFIYFLLGMGRAKGVSKMNLL